VKEQLSPQPSGCPLYRVFLRASHDEGLSLGPVIAKSSAHFV
jgi:hypothetical protein